MYNTRLGSAFVPVSDTERSARWYEETFGFRRRVVNEYSAWLDAPGGGTSLTLLGPASGIAAQPGLDWATCNLVVDDLDRVHRALSDASAAPTTMEGDPEICLFFTVRDPDGNQVLVVDR